MQLIYLAGAGPGAGLVNYCTGAGLCAGHDDAAATFDSIST